MAKQQAEPMWVARDMDCTSADLGCRDLSLHAEKPVPAGGEWGTDSSVGLYIDPAQSPVELPPGGGPVRVWLASEREHAIAKAARMLVRSTKDGLDIVASGYYDEIAGLMEGEG